MISASGWLRGLGSLFDGVTATAHYCEFCRDEEGHCGCCPCCDPDDGPFAYVDEHPGLVREAPKE